MEKRTKTAHRHSQRDYSLAIKLQVVQQVEKGELTYKKGSKTLRHPRELSWNLRNQYCKGVSKNQNRLKRTLMLLNKKYIRRYTR
jgi:hypothetical protein